MQSSNARVIDKDYKRTQITLGLGNIDNKYAIRPFRKAGILIIIIAVICLVLISYLPWAYFKYEPQNQEEFVEELYYKEDMDFNINQERFLNSENGSYYIGLSSGDFIYAYDMAFNCFVIFIAIGIVLSLFEIFTKGKKKFHEISILINSFAILIIALLCVFLVSIYIKFLSAHFLLFYNSSLISKNFTNISIIFPAAFIIVIIVSGILKIAFTTMKMYFKELGVVTKLILPRKSIYSFEKRSDYNE
jgi:hypothetical protein